MRLQRRFMAIVPLYPFERLLVRNRVPPMAQINTAASSMPLLHGRYIKYLQLDSVFLTFTDHVRTHDLPILGSSRFSATVCGKERRSTSLGTAHKLETLYS